jgi:hypothetical protein
MSENKRLSKTEIVEDLKKTAEIFDGHRHFSTSKWVRYIARNLEEDQFSDYKKDFFDVMDAFKNDVCMGNPVSGKIFSEIESVLGIALSQGTTRFHETLLQSYPLIQNWRKLRENAASINKIFLEKYSSHNFEECYYLSLFMYLLEVEGSFDDIVRILYILVLAAKNEKQIDYQQIFNKKLSDVKKDLVSLGFSDVFFNGWDDGHLRNAIAHAHFSFDEKTQTMTFSDFTPWDNKQVYEKSFTLDDFLQKAKMIADVAHIFTDFIILLRVWDIIKFKWSK